MASTPPRSLSLATLPLQGRVKRRADAIHRPHSLTAPGRPSPDLARASKKKRVRGTPGSRGTRAPRRLATSRPVEAGSNASPPFSRRSAQRVFWFAPFRPRWTDLFRLPLALGSPFHRCGTLNMAQRSDSAGAMTSGVPVARGWRAGTKAAWTAGFGIWRRISDAPDRPPLPAPHLKMLYRHPSLGRDAVAYSPRIIDSQVPFSAAPSGTGERHPCAVDRAIKAPVACHSSYFVLWQGRRMLYCFAA